MPLIQIASWLLESFEQRKHYNVPVAMSIHPGVCQYVKDFVTSLQPLIENVSSPPLLLCIATTNCGVQGQCHLISLVVHSTPLERHVFQLDRSTAQQGDTIYPSFRACLLKLNTLPSLLPIPHDDVTYTLGMETKGDSNVMEVGQSRNAFHALIHTLFILLEHIELDSRRSDPVLDSNRLGPLDTDQDLRCVSVQGKL
jgi:hypothetical protein